MAESGRRIGVSRWLSAMCGVALLLTLPACDQFTDLSETSDTAESAPPEMQVAVQAEAFRAIASTDLLRALQIYGTPKANLRFEALARDFAPNEDWQANYGLFLSTALTTVMQSDATGGTVSYYHPWSDVTLLVEWTKSEGQDSYRIASADIIPGAYVRGSPEKMSAFPGWMEQDAYAPQAVAETTARTVIALQKGYADGGKGPFAQLDPELREIMPAAASAPFEAFRNLVAPVYADMPSTRHMMREWLVLQADAVDGKTERSGRIGTGIKVLASLPAEVRNGFTPVGFIETDTARILMLASKVEPGITVTLRASVEGADAKLDRFDVVGFQPVLAAFDKGADQCTPIVSELLSP